MDSDIEIEKSSSDINVSSHNFALNSHHCLVKLTKINNLVRLKSTNKSIRPMNLFGKKKPTHLKIIGSILSTMDELRKYCYKKYCCYFCKDLNQLLIITVEEWLFKSLFFGCSNQIQLRNYIQTTLHEHKDSTKN